MVRTAFSDVLSGIYSEYLCLVCCCWHTTWHSHCSNKLTQIKDCQLNIASCCSSSSSSSWSACPLRLYFATQLSPHSLSSSLHLCFRVVLKLTQCLPAANPASPDTAGTQLSLCSSYWPSHKVCLCPPPLNQKHVAISERMTGLLSKP